MLPPMKAIVTSCLFSSFSINFDILSRLPRSISDLSTILSYICSSVSLLSSILIVSDDVSELLSVDSDTDDVVCVSDELSDDTAEPPLALLSAQPASIDAHSTAHSVILIFLFIFTSVRKNMSILLYINADR